MDVAATEREVPHGGEDAQRARRVMFADEAEPHGPQRDTRPSNGGESGRRRRRQRHQQEQQQQDQQEQEQQQQQQKQPSGAVADDHPPAEEAEATGHDANQPRGRGGRNRHWQRGRGGPAKVATVIAEALGLEEGSEESPKQRLDDYALLLSANENAARLQLEVMQLKEQEAMYKAHRALRERHLQRDGNPGGAPGQREATADA
ncbi:uncharacterized protein Tco025E_01474, partial [Trypanosoma conorhini]